MSEFERYPSPLPAPLSKAVRAGNFLFLSGQTPRNADLTPLRGDIKAQTANVLDSITATLAEFGLNLGAVIRCTVWLSDLALIKDFNEIYLSYFGANLPVRSTVEGKLVNNINVEIEVTAWIKERHSAA